LGEAARAELSPQLERKIGERILNEIRLREPSYVDDPELSDYLNNLGTAWWLPVRTRLPTATSSLSATTRSMRLPCSVVSSA
jgi:hypothetical protein